MYTYINFVCHVQKCQYIYIYIYIYISKTRHLFLNKLYFGFFQTFEDSKKNPKYNSLRNKCLVFDICIYIYICLYIYMSIYICYITVNYLNVSFNLNNSIFRVMGLNQNLIT